MTSPRTAGAESAGTGTIASVMAHLAAYLHSEEYVLNAEGPLDQALHAALLAYHATLPAEPPHAPLAMQHSDWQSRVVGRAHHVLWVRTALTPAGTASIHYGTATYPNIDTAYCWKRRFVPPAAPRTAAVVFGADVGHNGRPYTFYA